MTEKKKKKKKVPREVHNCVATDVLTLWIPFGSWTDRISFALEIDSYCTRVSAVHFKIISGLSKTPVCHEVKSGEPQSSLRSRRRRKRRPRR